MKTNFKKIIFDFIMEGNDLDIRDEYIHLYNSRTAITGPDEITYYFIKYPNTCFYQVYFYKVTPSGRLEGLDIKESKSRFSLYRVFQHKKYSERTILYFENKWYIFPKNIEVRAGRNAFLFNPIEYHDEVVNKKGKRHEMEKGIFNYNDIPPMLAGILQEIQNPEF
jgi:hypothetical protein